MNILISVLIAVIIIFAIKTRNSSLNLGLGNKRFALGVLCGLFPYVDQLINLSNTNYELHYQHTFMWSLILMPIYALALTGLIKSAYGEDVDAKYIYPALLIPTVVVILLNFLSVKEIALFYPFSNHKFSLNIISEFSWPLLLIGITGVSAIVFIKKYRKYIARFFAVIVLTYVLSLASFAFKARSEAKDYAAALDLDIEKIYTIAQSSSVFNWQVMLFTKDEKVHTAMISLKNESIDPDYKAAANADWRIYRLINPYYRAHYNVVKKHFGDKPIAKNILKYSILTDSVNYKNYRCLRFKDLRKSYIEKSVEGYSLFCQNPATKRIRTYIGTIDGYKNVYLQ